MSCKTLSSEDVRYIYGVLVDDHEQTDDPIAPSGISSENLLESAVSRQHVGHQGELKHPDAIGNAATLTYGICCNHPFVNGNKRTALVAMLAHLDKNKLTLFNTTQDDLYNLMIEIADHSLGVRIDKRARNKGFERLHSDEEVEQIAIWLNARSAKIETGKRVITYRQLKQILKSFGYYLENPHGNTIDVVRYSEVEKGFFKKRTQVVGKKIGNIGWPGEGTEVSHGQVKRIREMCKLREEDGVDSDAFYSYMAVVDYFINRYRKVLRRLAKT